MVFFITENHAGTSIYCQTRKINDQTTTHTHWKKQQVPSIRVDHSTNWFFKCSSTAWVPLAMVAGRGSLNGFPRMLSNVESSLSETNSATNLRRPVIWVINICLVQGVAVGYCCFEHWMWSVCPQPSEYQQRRVQATGYHSRGFPGFVLVHRERQVIERI